jgi:hypothetical protein
LTGPVAEKLLFLQVNLPRVGYKWKPLPKEQMAVLKFTPTFPNKITAPDKPSNGAAAAVGAVKEDDWINDLNEIDDQYANDRNSEDSDASASSVSDGGTRTRRARRRYDPNEAGSSYVCVGHGYQSGDDDEKEY